MVSEQNFNEAKGCIEACREFYTTQTSETGYSRVLLVLRESADFIPPLQGTQSTASTYQYRFICKKTKNDTTPVSHKKRPLALTIYHIRIFAKLRPDFQNSISDRLLRKLATKLILNLSPHPPVEATLPCKILFSKNYNNLL